MLTEPIRSDPFFLALLTKLPAETRASFSEAQLNDLKQALDTKHNGSHAVDLRWTLGFWCWNFSLLTCLVETVASTIDVRIEWSACQWPLR